MKKSIPFYISAFIFFISSVLFISYLFSVRTEEGEFESVKEKLSVSDESEYQGGLGYYLIDGVVVQEEFKDLYLENSDIIGWISLEGTKIDYPVMCSDYYLHRDFSKNYSFAGSIFTVEGTDIERPSDNMILCGHHMVDDGMFGVLDHYESEEFFKSHRYIRFDTLRQTGTYEVIAAFRTEISEDGFRYYEYMDMGREEFEEYITTCQELTPYETGEVSYGDQLITLSTCAYHAKDGRFVVVAKRVKGREVDLERGEMGVIRTGKSQGQTSD